MSSSEPLNVVVGRQPIFDTHRRVVAHELLFRRPGGAGPEMIDGDAATAQVIVNALTEIGLDRVAGAEPVFLNCTRHFLENDPILPPAQCVLEVLETVAVDDTVIEGVRRLHKKGYRIALDDFIYSEVWEPLLALADYVKVDIRAHSPPELEAAVRRLSRYKATLLAEKVENAEELELCKKLGFKLFQGYYLRRPETLEGRRSPLSRSAALRVVGELASPDADLNRVAAGIAGDPMLSYRLLQFANSGLIPLRGRVDSIKKAVNIVGTDMLLRWATVLVLTGIDDNPRGYSEIALQRAKACEVIAQRRHQARPELAYVAGLFSLLDSMLQMPMEQIAATLPLPAEVVRAIEGKGGDLGGILGAVVAYENGGGMADDSLQEAFWDGVSYARRMLGHIESR